MGAIALSYPLLFIFIDDSHERSLKDVSGTFLLVCFYV